MNRERLDLRRAGEPVTDVREEVAASVPAAVLHLQRTAGNQAVTRMLAPSGPMLQRAISIGGERVTHASKRLGDLFNDVVAPALDAHGFKTYGVKSRLVDFVRAGAETQFTDTADFLGKFLPWLGAQMRTVRGGKQTPVLKQFTVQGMSRPAWPAALKALKAIETGDNVRHVVRNATIKRALEAEWNRLDDTARRPRLAEIAQGLGIAVAPHATAGDMAKAIYDLTYLNPDNLFAGNGPMNQVIGFSADPVRRLGEELLELGEQEVDLIDVDKGVMQRVYDAVNRVPAHRAELEWISWRIAEVVQAALGSLRPDGVSTKVPAEVAGDMVADIGLGFGFDFIDGRTPADQQNIGARQGRLLWSETALGAFAASGGTQGDLLEIFQVFLGHRPAPV